MSRGRWTFRTLPEELRNTNAWRTVDESALSEGERQRFDRLKRGVQAYLSNGRLLAASKYEGCTPEAIIRSLNRCVALGPDGTMMGWSGLLAGKRIKQYKRTSKLPNGDSAGSVGGVGAFHSLLERYPRIKEKLEQLILKTPKRGVIHEARISAKVLHMTFVRLCEDAGLTSQHYPLNTASRGRRSVERFIHEVVAANLVAGTAARYGKDAASRLRLGTGHPRRVQAAAPYDLVGLDAHELHCFGTVRVNGPAGPQWIAIERIWIVVVLENESRAILGYSVGIRTECSSATIEAAIKSAVSVWKPRKLAVPGMSYRPNAGLPSGVISELAGCGWNTLSLDNAAAHYGTAIAERARRRVCGYLTYGAIGQWDHRAVLERLMSTLEGFGFQRLPSTTGSGPRDTKVDKPVRKAIDGRIEWEHLVDVVDVICADYNDTKTEPLGNRSPLSTLRDHLSGTTPSFLPRRFPPPTAFQPEIGVTVERRTVRGSLDKGKRPHICIDRVTYTSIVLANQMALIDKELLVHIDESDMRSVRAYFSSGEELGVLTASGNWSRTPHTREIRKQINSLRDVGNLDVRPGQDPVEALLAFLALKTLADGNDKPTKVSKNATALARVAHATGLPVPSAPSVPESSEQKSVTAPVTPSRLVVIPLWKTRVK